MKTRMTLMAGMAVCTLLLASGGVLPGGETVSPIRVLLFSGQNNHDWKTTTPRLKEILTAGGRFAVQITERPDQCTTEDFRKCDVIVCNWNSWGNVPVKDWPKPAREAFLEFIRNGGGQVVVHAGSSTFFDWPDYQKIAGAWWDLKNTSHGVPHEFAVQLDAGHPVTRGVPAFRTRDELWMKPGVHPDARIIATAGGQPLVVATEFGRGRGLCLLLGHSAEFMNASGFQTLLLRGTEWAATGKVTIRGVGETAVTDPEEIIRKVAAYRFGDSREGVKAFEQMVHAAAADETERKKMAQRLVLALGEKGTVDGKKVICRGVSLIGGGESIPVLIQSMQDATICFDAKQALERMPDKAVDEVLTKALLDGSGQLRAEYIDILAVRGAKASASAIARYLTDADKEVARAAMAALGRLGGEQAMQALIQAGDQSDQIMKAALGSALLECAGSLESEGRKDQARVIYEKLGAAGQPYAVRVNALSARMALMGPEAQEQVLVALQSTDGIMRQAAIRYLTENRDATTLVSIVRKMDGLPCELQEKLLVLCAERGDGRLVPDVIKASASTNDALRFAAVKTLGAIGDSTAVRPLMQLAGKGTSDEDRIIMDALARIRGKDVDAALAAALKAGSVNQQKIIVRTLVLRSAQSAVPEMLALAESGESTLRREAIGAIGKLGGAGVIGALMPILDKMQGNEQGLVESALVEIGRRDASTTSVIAGQMAKVSPSSRAVLLSVLGSVGGTSACSVVQSQLQSPDEGVLLAATRVLADWPDAEPLDALASLVERTGDARIRAIACRGLSRMAPRSPDRALRAAKALARGLDASNDVSEQRNYISALAGMPCVAGLQAIQARLTSPVLAGESAAGVISIGEVIYPWHKAEIREALKAVRTVSLDAQLLKRLQALEEKLGKPANLAVGGLATSPDGLEKDGQASGDQAAIDGDPKTYWDEEDNQKLYVLKIQLREHSKVRFLRIMGFQHHNYAPRDFEVLCDGKVIKTITGAKYNENWFQVEIPPTECDSLELKITGYYGRSPAIRELEIYEQNN